MRVMALALPELGANPAAGMKRLQNLVVEQRRIAVELARYDAGRAAAILFLLDRLAPTLQKGVDLALAEAVKAIRAGFVDALALRAKHKGTSDVDRIVYTFAMFHADRALAFDAVAAPPGTAAEADPALYIQRARTALTIASMIPDGSRLDPARRLIEDLLPSEDADLEAQREILLGDVEVMRARLRGERSAWAVAAAHYQAGRKKLKDGRGRVANNLGWIALEQGDVARAQELFKEATLDAKTDRRWIAYLNAALPLGQRSPDAVRAVREIASATRKDGRPPVVASTWLAALSTDPAETRKAARDALDEMDAPLYAMKPDTAASGMDSEGSFQIGLGLSSRHRFHELASYAFSSVWLMPKLPLAKRELVDLARR
jgi:tetratricopeptide (TPR) repeat protein